MCFPSQPQPRPIGEMGFDASMLKSVLESFVEEINEESMELILERPRFAYAVVVVTDDKEGALCQASCVRQLDDVAVQMTSEIIEQEDEEIQRALRELRESRDMLNIRQSLYMDHSDEANDSEKEGILSNDATNRLLKEINKSASVINKQRIEFPSMNRLRANT